MIEIFADKLPCRQNDSWLLRGRCFQFRQDRVTILSLHPAMQDKESEASLRHPCSQFIQMIAPLSKDNYLASFSPDDSRPDFHRFWLILGLFYRVPDRPGLHEVYWIESIPPDWSGGQAEYPAARRMLQRRSRNACSLLTPIVLPTPSTRARSSYSRRTVGIPWRSRRPRPNRRFSPHPPAP